MFLKIFFPILRVSQQAVPETFFLCYAITDQNRGTTLKKINIKLNIIYHMSGVGHKSRTTKIRAKLSFAKGKFIALHPIQQSGTC